MTKTKKEKYFYLIIPSNWKTKKGGSLCTLYVPSIKYHIEPNQKGYITITVATTNVIVEESGYICSDIRDSLNAYYSNTIHTTNPHYMFYEMKVTRENLFKFLYPEQIEKIVKRKIKTKHFFEFFRRKRKKCLLISKLKMQPLVGCIF